MQPPLEDYNTPTRRRLLAIKGHGYGFSWLRMRRECECGRRVCCLAAQAAAEEAARPTGVESC